MTSVSPRSRDGSRIRWMKRGLRAAAQGHAVRNVARRHATGRAARHRPTLMIVVRSRRADVRRMRRRTRALTASGRGGRPTAPATLPSVAYEGALGKVGGLSACSADRAAAGSCSTGCSPCLVVGWFAGWPRDGAPMGADGPPLTLPEPGCVLPRRQADRWTLVACAGVISAPRSARELLGHPGADRRGRPDHHGAGTAPSLRVRRPLASPLVAPAAGLRCSRFIVHSLSVVPALVRRAAGPLGRGVR